MFNVLIQHTEYGTHKIGCGTLEECLGDESLQAWFQSGEVYSCSVYIDGSTEAVFAMSTLPMTWESFMDHFFDASPTILRAHFG